jgi:hypothetical protein
MVQVGSATPAWPTVTDDSGNLTSGTKFDAAYDQAAQDTLDALLHSSADPTVSPADVIAEMKDARGNEASLNARLSGVVDADGNPVGVVAPSHIRNGFVYGNLLANDTFAMWALGDAAAPDHWTISGSGAAVARCGVGQADTTVLSGMDHFSAKLTYGSAAAILYQDAIAAGALARLDQGFLNRYRPVDANGAQLAGYDDDADPTLNAYLIGHVKCSGASLARLRLDQGTPGAYSDYHPGDGSWHTLIAGPMSHSVSAGRYRAQCRVEASGSAYFQGLSMVLTPAGLAPMYVPARVRYKTLTYYTNNPATGVLTYFTFARPAFIVGAQMQCLTAGTGTAATCDLLTPISGTYQSLFATLPTIAINQLVGAAQACDPAAANYRRRTIRPALSANATQVDNTSLRLDYVDDGGGALRDLMVTIHYFEYDRPLEQFRTASELGE